MIACFIFFGILIQNVLGVSNHCHHLRLVWRLKRTWKKQVEDESVMVGLRKEGAFYRSKCCVGIEVNLATLTFLGYYQILGIGVCLSEDVLVSFSLQLLNFFILFTVQMLMV